MPDRSDNEQEWLRKLSERQIARRDPQIKERKVAQTVTRKYRSRKAVTLGELFAGVPHKWQGLFIGGFIGFIGWVLLSMLVEAAWVDLAGLLAVFFLGVLGLFIGNGFDVRDRLNDV